MTLNREVQVQCPDRRRFLQKSFRLGASAWAAASLAELGTIPPGVRASEAEGLKARVTIDATHVLHDINPNIYGSFIEHIGRCVYGGVYEENSPLSDAQGFRQDVMRAASEWGPPILRWPGGNFSSGYHWQDGVGPKEARPRRVNAAWFEEESNHFGTDEFVDYCRKIGAEPYICVNLGTGTIEEAANWVEYCNGAGNTSYANLRRQYGHAQPHRVRYWALGNEIYGVWQIGYKNAEDYAKMALEFGKLMKWVDPGIQLVACGSPDPAWNRVVLEKLVDIADYISLHDYEGNPGYYEELATIRRFETQIKLMADAIELTDSLRGADPVLALSLNRTAPKKPMEIACDEWNIWYRQRDIFRRDVPNPVEEKYDLRDALWVASVLNLFQRQGNKVTMANIAQMVNVIGTMFTNEKGMFRQTIYFPMKLYRHECGTWFLASNVESPVFSSASFKDVPYLDVSATLDDHRTTISLAVVNRHQSEPIAAHVEIRDAKVQGNMLVYEINGASPDIENSFAEPDKVKVVRKDSASAGNNFDYVFPAHSVTLLKLERT